MRRKILYAVTISAVLLCSCGSGSEDVASDTGGISTESASQPATDQENEEKGELSDLDALGEVNVTENIFDVEITIPADYVGETTQEDLDATCAEYGYKSIILNDDGSATYTMTKAQHEEMLAEIAKSTNESLSEMVGSEDYPNITGIKANDNFTEFIVTTTSTELSLEESFSVMTYYMYGGMYAIFSGEEVDNISVTFINAESGEVIEIANSSEMGND